MMSGDSGLRKIVEWHRGSPIQARQSETLLSWLPWWWRRCLRARLGGRPRRALRTATDIDHRAVAALHLRVHPAQNELATIEGNHFTILRACRIAVGRSDIRLAADASQTQLGRCRLVSHMHHDAAAGTGRDHVRLLALTSRCRLGPRAIFFLVIGREPPTPNDILRREGWGPCLNHGWCSGLIELRPARTAGQREC